MTTKQRATCFIVMTLFSDPHELNRVSHRSVSWAEAMLCSTPYSVIDPPMSRTGEAGFRNVSWMDDREQFVLTT